MHKTYPILHVSGPVARLYDGGHTVGQAQIDDNGIVVGLFERHFGVGFGYNEVLKERQLPVISATITEAAIELLTAAYTRETYDEDGDSGKTMFDCDGLRLTGERHEELERWLAGLEVPIVVECGA